MWNLLNENHGNLDELIRIRINEFVGYKVIHRSMFDIFKYLGMDYNNRQDYNKILGIIHKDRQDFCKIWVEAKEKIVDGTNQTLYTYCLKVWSKKNRVLIYNLGDGWGTPKEYKIYKGIEEKFGIKDVQTVVNKIRQLELPNIYLPYNIDIDKLDNELKDHRKLLEDKEEEDDKEDDKEEEDDKEDDKEDKEDE